MRPRYTVICAVVPPRAFGRPARAIAKASAIRGISRTLDEPARAPFECPRIPCQSTIAVLVGGFGSSKVWESRFVPCLSGATGKRVREVGERGTRFPRDSSPARAKPDTAFLIESSSRLM